MRQKTGGRSGSSSRPRPARAKPKVTGKPATINEYLARVSPDKRAALERLRRIIRATVPGAEECISYRLPAFRVGGRVALWFGAGANHCAFYPGAVVQDLGPAIAQYDTSKGTIRFQPDAPLPEALIRKLVRARIARSTARSGKDGK